MNKVATSLNILIICLVIGVGILTGIGRVVDPWWTIYYWLGIIIISRIEIQLYNR